MNEERWSAVDTYFTGLFGGDDAVLETALKASAAGGLPPHDVASNQGKFLHLLARLQGAKQILEIGTLGGYSTIWLARALPDGGRVITIEADPEHAEVARQNVEMAGLSDRVDIRVGLALDLLPELEAFAPFDLTFIDADKKHNTEYFEWALKLSRIGSLIIADNVVRDGEVIDPTSEDTSVQGVRRWAERVAAEPRVSVTALQTVGNKGYDGFALALVTK